MDSEGLQSFQQSVQLVEQVADEPTRAYLILAPTRSRVRLLQDDGQPGEEIAPRIWLVNSSGVRADFDGDEPEIVARVPYDQVDEGKRAAELSRIANVTNLKTFLGRHRWAAGSPVELAASRRFFLTFDFVTAQPLNISKQQLEGPRSTLVREFAKLTGPKDEAETVIVERALGALFDALEYRTAFHELSDSLSKFLMQRLEAARVGKRTRPCDRWYFTSTSIEALGISFEGGIDAIAAILERLFCSELQGPRETFWDRFARAFLAFADGTLRFGAASRHFNCEPDSILLFTLAEFSLSVIGVAERENWNPERLEFWTKALAVFVDIQDVYVRRYGSPALRKRDHYKERELSTASPEDPDAWLIRGAARATALRLEPGSKGVLGYTTLYEANLLSALAHE